MFEIHMINEESICDLDEMKCAGCTNILYGAGSTGRECLSFLLELEIPIHYFCDDNPSKWGERMENIEIMNPQKILAQKDGLKKINLVITSIYAKHIYTKLPANPNIIIYEMFEIYGKDKGLVNEIGTLTEQEREKYQNQLKMMQNMFRDSLSIKTLWTIGNAVLNENKSIKCLRDIVSEEECYFIKEILEMVGSEINFIDAGAYHGEISSVLDELNIHYNNLYCFEVEKRNFQNLTKKANSKMVCVNKGLWDKTGRIYVEGEGAETRVVEYTTDDAIEVVSIDEYFTDIKIDFIKMDIEGAEMKALLGSEKVLHRDRPILAISIYHSLADFVEIPLYLSEQLRDYKFYLRHHSMIFAETVLYGIPDEYTYSKHE